MLELLDGISSEIQQNHFEQRPIGSDSRRDAAGSFLGGQRFFELVALFHYSSNLFLVTCEQFLCRIVWGMTNKASIRLPDGGLGMMIPDLSRFLFPLAVKCPHAREHIGLGP